MKTVLLAVLRGLTWVALLLAFFPVLFPAVMVIGVVVSVGILVFFRGEMGRRTSGRLSLFAKSAPASKVLRRSVLAMGISLSLYLLVWVHSQLFYVGPLKRDQEPFRRDAFEQLRESGGSSK